jgi:hypothetical protein
MTVLSNLIDAQIKDAKTTLYGKVLTRPALLVTDGQEAIYAVDVDIGIVDPTGYDETLDLQNQNITGSVLHNVPIARGNDALIYADVGAAVTLTRSVGGRYEVSGFSQILPGTNIRYAVNLEDMTLGGTTDNTWTARPLTLGELGTLAPFGNLPLGAIGIYRGGVLQRIQ